MEKINTTNPVRELPSAETLSSLLWRDWMTTEQADGLGRDMHGWLQAHAALAKAPAVRVTHQMVLKANTQVPVIGGKPVLTYCQVRSLLESALGQGKANGQ